MQEPSPETIIKVVKEHFNFTIDDSALFVENIDDILAEAEEEGYSLSVAELAWLKHEYAEETEETVS